MNLSLCKMDFSERSLVKKNEGGITISNRSILYEAPDGSIHQVPVINICVMESTSEEGTSRNLTNRPDDEIAIKIVGLDDLFTKLHTTESTIEFLREIKLLKSSHLCDNCNIPMILRNYSSKDGKCFHCKACKKQSSIRDQSFFEKSKLPLHTIVKIMYMWSLGIQSFIVERLFPNISDKSIQDWFSFYRDICIKYYEHLPLRFEKTDVRCEVQLDESIFGKKRKYNKGKNFSRYWLFGISDQKNHKCHVQVVQDRSKETLEEIILSHQKPIQQSYLTDGLLILN